MKANLNTCHILLSTTEVSNLEISETVIVRRNSNSKKLFGVTFDNKLEFPKHINNIYQRANRKLNSLAGMTANMELGKKVHVDECIFQFLI